MNDDIARVTKVRAIGARSLRVRVRRGTARPGTRHDRTDRPQHAFRTADGRRQDLCQGWNRGRGPWSILACPDKVGRLDVSATTLRRIAEEQQPMTGADFAEWRRALGLSLTEAAKLLGVGRRTIMGYLKKDDLPPVVAIACRALARDKHVLAAHYVPARKVTRRAA